MKKYPVIIVLLFLFINCKNSPIQILPGNKWNNDFCDGTIRQETIIKELPIGSKYEALSLYLTKNKVPKYNDSTTFGYSDRNYTKEYPAEVSYLEHDNEYKNKLSYYVRIDGHKELNDFPHYYHPIILFLYDENDTLFYIGQHGYP